MKDYHMKTIKRIISAITLPGLLVIGALLEQRELVRWINIVLYSISILWVFTKSFDEHVREPEKNENKIVSAIILILNFSSISISFIFEYNVVGILQILYVKFFYIRYFEIKLQMKKEGG